MTTAFRLLPLDCPSCGAALAAEGEDVVYYCTACAAGFRLGAGPATEGTGGGGEVLVPVEVSFVASPGTAAAVYLPFWLLGATVTLHERQAAGGSWSGLVSFFLGDRSTTGTAPGEGTFAIPAFACPLGEAVALAGRYTQALPELGERLGERLTGGCYGVEDAQKLAHFTLIAAEAEKPDTLRRLEYSIDFGPARLLGVPFVRHGSGLADAVFGLATGRVPG